MLLNLLCVGCFAVRIVSGLLDLYYSSGKLAYIGLWRRKVRRSIGGEPCGHHVWCGALCSMGRPGGCGGYPSGRCSPFGVYPGRYRKAVFCKEEMSVVYVLWFRIRVGLYQNFYDVTIVDVGDVPESAVPIQELSLLRQQLYQHVAKFHLDWIVWIMLGDSSSSCVVGFLEAGSLGNLDGHYTLQ